MLFANYESTWSTVVPKLIAFDYQTHHNCSLPFHFGNENEILNFRRFNNNSNSLLEAAPQNNSYSYYKEKVIYLWCSQTNNFEKAFIFKSSEEREIKIDEHNFQCFGKNLYRINKRDFIYPNDPFIINNEYEKLELYAIKYWSDALIARSLILNPTLFYVNSKKD